jgi:hypothetical protein
LALTRVLESAGRLRWRQLAITLLLTSDHIARQRQGS